MRDKSQFEILGACAVRAEQEKVESGVRHNTVMAWQEPTGCEIIRPAFWCDWALHSTYFRKGDTLLDFILEACLSKSKTFCYYGTITVQLSAAILSFPFLYCTYVPTLQLGCQVYNSKSEVRFETGIWFTKWSIKNMSFSFLSEKANGGFCAEPCEMVQNIYLMDEYVYGFKGCDLSCHG